MAGTQIQRRRGTTTEHSTFTGALGEVTIDTTKKTAVVHDGATAGGLALAREDLSNVSPLSTAKHADNSITPAKLVNSGAELGMRNRIINGSMAVSQRGTVFSAVADSTYTLDRWTLTYNGSGGTRNISQLPFAMGSVEADYLTNYLEFQQSVAGSGGTYNTLNTRIEDARTLSGKTVTLSFYARFFGSSNTLPQIVLRQNFGSGGSTFVDTVITTSVAIGTGFARYTVTATLPSVTGKTLGSSSFLELICFLPINQTFTFHISGIQLEQGSAATPFEFRSYGTELALCQRYYQGSQQYYGLKVASGYARVSFPIPVMRAAPTVTYADNGGTANRISTFTGADVRTDGRTPVAVTGSNTGAFFVLPNNTDSDIAFTTIASLSAEL